MSIEARIEARVNMPDEARIEARVNMPIEARIEAGVNMPDGVESKVNVARGNMSNAGQMRQEGICQAP